MSAALALLSQLGIEPTTCWLGFKRLFLCLLHGVGVPGPLHGAGGIKATSEKYPGGHFPWCLSIRDSHSPPGGSSSRASPAQATQRVWGRDGKCGVMIFIDNIRN